MTGSHTISEHQHTANNRNDPVPYSWQTSGPITLAATDFEPITKSAFPRNTRQHVYTNGSIEAVLGLGFSSRQTRSLATVGLIGYLAYRGGNAIRQSQKG